MGLISESIVPAKFISCISHVLMMITLFWTYEDNLKKGLVVGYSSTEHLNAQISIFVCVIISLSMQVFEIIVLFIGYSLFFDTINMIQVIFHMLGTVLTSWFVQDNWEYTGIWGIWFFTILFPFALDIIVLFKAKTLYGLKN